MDRPDLNSTKVTLKNIDLSKLQTEAMPLPMSKIIDDIEAAVTSAVQVSYAWDPSLYCYNIKDRTTSLPQLDKDISKLGEDLRRLPSLTTSPTTLKAFYAHILELNKSLHKTLSKERPQYPSTSAHDAAAKVSETFFGMRDEANRLWKTDLELLCTQTQDARNIGIGVVDQWTSTQKINKEEALRAADSIKKVNIHLQTIAAKKTYNSEIDQEKKHLLIDLKATAKAAQQNLELLSTTSTTDTGNKMAELIEKTADSLEKTNQLTDKLGALELYPPIIEATPNEQMRKIMQQAGPRDNSWRQLEIKRIAYDTVNRETGLQYLEPYNNICSRAYKAIVETDHAVAYLTHDISPPCDHLIVGAHKALQQLRTEEQELRKVSKPTGKNVPTQYVQLESLANGLLNDMSDMQQQLASIEMMSAPEKKITKGLCRDLGDAARRYFFPTRDRSPEERLQRWKALASPVQSEINLLGREIEAGKRRIELIQRQMD